MKPRLWPNNNFRLGEGEIQVKSRTVFFLMALCVAAAAWAADGNYSENLIVNMQTGNSAWHLDKSYNQPTNIMQEYVPEGQTGQDWSEMITLMTFKNHPEIDTGKMIANIVQKLRGTCANVSILAKDARQQSNDLRKSKGLPSMYQTYSVLVRCDSPNPNGHPGVPTKKYEVVWFKGIQGWLTSYMVQRAWHGDDITPDSILGSDQTRQAWQQWIDSTGISGLPDSARP